MTDPRMRNLANILVNYSVAVRPGDWVVINGHVLALPLVNEVVRLVLRAGGNPTVQLSADEIEETILRESSEAQLAWISPLTTESMPEGSRFVRGLV